MAENKQEIPGISQIGIKKDLALFKDEILKDIRSVQLSLDDKYIKADDFLKQRITEFELKINAFNKKIFELSNLIITDTSIREKVESLNQFKEEMKDAMFKRRAKFNDFETTVNNDISRINNILSNTVIYPALIGKTAKFKNFHEFMDYIIQEIAQLMIFKDKSGLDLTPYKKKIEQTIESFKLQMNGFSSKEYTDNAVNACEERIKGSLKIFDDRLQDTRVENSHYSFGIKKKAEEMEKQISILEKLQKNILGKFEKYKRDDSLYITNNEINSIKNKISKINEVIKELLSYHPNTRKNFIHEFEKKSSKVYSGVKQYIKGNINANELSTMKKFTYEKSKTKVFDNPSPKPISNFAYQDLIKNNSEFQKRNSYLINNEQYLYGNSRNNSGQIDKSKIFLSKKTMNYSNKTDSINRQFIEDDLYIVNNNNRDDNEEENENSSFNKKKLFRRKTYNFAKLKSFENKENNLISDEPNKLYNLSKLNNNNEETSSLVVKEDLNNQDQNEFNPISRVNTIKEKSKTNNHFIIKEEDENILSDNSTKNLHIINDKLKNKIIKKNSKKEINKYFQEEISRNKKEEVNKNSEEETVKYSIDETIKNSKEEINKNSKEETINNPKEEINKNSKEETIKSNINNEDSKKNILINNNEEKKLPSLKNETDKMRIKSLKELINSNNTDNNNGGILTLNKKINANNIENKNSGRSVHFRQKNQSINNFEQSNLMKNNSNNNINIAKIICDNNNNTITPRINIKENNQENTNKIIINKNSSYPKASKNNNNLSKNNPLQNYRNLENNSNLNHNQYPVNYNIKSNNKNIVSIKKMNKTQTSFPKINQELPENKLLLNNNYIDSKDMNVFTKTLSTAKMSHKIMSKTSQYEKTPKKVLLINPDNIPPNMVIRRIIKNGNKNNSIGIESEKNAKTKRMDNLYNNENQYYIRNQLNSTDDEIHKSLNNIKTNKNP